MDRQWHNKINKSVKASVIRRGDVIENGPRIPTGSLSLDAELGGGFASGKINTISGNESSGKTSIVLKTVAEFQKKWPDKEVVWIDVEGAWDKKWASILGVDVKEITLVEPQYSEQAFDIAEKAVINDAGLIVIDSITALAPKAELEGDMETVLVGLQARLNSKFFRKAQSALLDQRENELKPTFIMISQLREQIGMHLPDVEPGGRAIKFYSSIKVKIQRGDLYPSSKFKSDEGVEPKAQAIHFHILKNKTAPSYRRGHFWFYFDTMDKYRPKGCYDVLEEIIRYAIKYRIINQRTSAYDLPDPESGEIKTFKGSAKLASYIRENENVSKWISEEVIRKATLDEPEIEEEGTIPEDEEGQGEDSGKPIVRIIDEGEGEADFKELESTTAT